MKKALVALVLAASFAAPAFAEETGAAAVISAAPAVQSSSAVLAASQHAAARGQSLRSNTGTLVGRVVRANDDGSVVIIMQSRAVTVPASTLSVSGEQLVTSLSRSEVAAIR